jgi:hypothetical protein
VLHTLGTGSDVRSGWAVAIGLGCVGAVVLAVAWRLIGEAARVHVLVRAAGMAATAAATISLLGFAAAGPLHSGWAKAAGTPDRLLAAAGTGPQPAPSAAPTLAVGLTDQLSGTLVQSGRRAQVTLTDARDAKLRITINLDAGSATAQLIITDNGAAVCSAAASVAQDVLATCGRTAVDIGLNQQADGSLVGQMVTRAAGQ